jgi:hypothetical protein
MSTLAEMRSRIADDLNRTDMNTQIDKFINRSIIAYKKEPLWFTETSATFSTIASQSTYGSADGVPTTIDQIDYMEVTVDSSNKYKIIPKDFSDIIRLLGITSSTQQYPSYYAFYKNTIYFYPTPSTVRTITIYFKKSYATLALDADTNDWLTEAEDLIEARATWMIYKRVIKDYQAAQDAKVEEMEAIEFLRQISKNKVARGQIKATRF